MSDTPETRAEKINKRDTYLLPEMSEWVVTAEFAEKLERERDEAIKQKVLAFNALRAAWSVIDHALQRER